MPAQARRQIQGKQSEFGSILSPQVDLQALSQGKCHGLRAIDRKARADQQASGEVKLWTFPAPVAVPVTELRQKRLGLAPVSTTILGQNQDVGLLPFQGVEYGLPASFAMPHIPVQNAQL